MSSESAPSSSHSASLARDLSYITNHTLTCLAYDLAGIGMQHMFQKSKEDEEHKGSLGQLIVGEFGGDIAAIPVTLAAQYVAPNLMKSVASGYGALMDPLYDYVGRKTLIPWAQKHQVGSDSPEFEAKLSQWKQRQYDQIPQTVIWTAASVVANAAVQRAMGSTHSWGTLLKGKLAFGTFVPAAISVGTHIVFPTQARAFEKLGEEYVYKPLIEKMPALVMAYDQQRAV